MFEKGYKSTNPDIVIVPQDPQKAQQYYEEAVGLGYPRAMNNLAALLINIKSDDE